jgi:hypothetical protein
MSNTVEDTRYINLNTQHAKLSPSFDGYSKSYLSNLNFDFKGLLKEENDILYSTIDIVNAQIPVSFYNINAATNILKFAINNGVILTLTIDKANYSLTSLITILTSLF